MELRRGAVHRVFSNCRSDTRGNIITFNKGLGIHPTFRERFICDNGRQRSIVRAIRGSFPLGIVC